MGGFGSNRWVCSTTQATTDGLLALDVRRLTRQGALSPGRYEITWSGSGGATNGVTVVAEAGAVVLDYRVPVGNGATTEVRDRVPLALTPCHYGGHRPWFVCPGCAERRAVLYCCAGLFRCRDCHNLAYASTRETAVDRMMRRATEIRSRLDGPTTGGGWELPPKAKGMRQVTYRRLVRELVRCEATAIRAITASSGRLVADAGPGFGSPPDGPASPPGDTAPNSDRVAVRWWSELVQHDAV